ncbi:MAG: ROK family protein [Sphingobium sp.]
MPDNRLRAGVELGGTKTIVVLARGTQIVREAVIRTGLPETCLTEASAVLRQWQREAEFDALGIASFGPLELDPSAPAYGHMLDTPKQGWAGAEILGMLSAGLDCPVVIDTDVNGAALAETLWGAGAEVAGASDCLCYLTIGTGLGAGFVVNGRPLHGAMHPEAGHLRMRRGPGDDFPGVCPFHGDCIEGLVSGPALAARFGMPGEQVPDGDPRWAHVADALAELVSSILLMTSARMVLIGGGVGTTRPALRQLVRERVVSALAGYLPFVTTGTIADIIREPALGTRAGPLGAIALAAMSRRSRES